MNGAPVCTVVVSLGDELAPTGAEPAFAVVAVAAALVAIGAVLLLRRRARSSVLGGSALAVAVAVVAAALVCVPSTAHAASGDTRAPRSCDLIAVDADAASRPDAANLLPGQRVSVVTVAVTNRVAFPLAVTARLRLDSPAADAVAFVADIVDPATERVVATGALPAMPDASQTLAPGETVRLRYDIAVDPLAGNAAQGLSAQFSAVITATGP